MTEKLHQLSNSADPEVARSVQGFQEVRGVGVVRVGVGVVGVGVVGVVGVGVGVGVVGVRVVGVRVRVGV